MKKIIILISLFTLNSAFSQEHFGGFTTSTRVGLLNASINPSELVNLKSKFEVQIASVSLNVSNNKIGFKDIINGTNIEKKLFDGGIPVTFNVDAEIMGPSVALKVLGWGFAVQTKAYVKSNATDIDATLGDALTNNGLGSILSSKSVTSGKNQRLNGAAYGEISLSAAHKIIENESHQLNGGVAIKLLFPGAYANIGLDQFKGTISNTGTNVYLSNASAGVNIAYSTSLANNFANADDYTNNLFGSLNGFATDLGVNYVLKSTLTDYRLKIGASVRNIGTMTFKGNNNQTTNYTLSIPPATLGSPGLNLNQFNGSESPKDIENVLLTSGYLTKKDQSGDVIVKLPTVFNLYADLQILPKLNITAFYQQKLNENSDNDQITTQNSLSLTPRFNIRFFEVFTPFVINETAGTTAGLGLRIGGFFVGSNSIITALTSDSKQADAYFGFRFGFL